MSNFECLPRHTPIFNPHRTTCAGNGRRRPWYLIRKFGIEVASFGLFPENRMELKNRLVKSPSHVHGELCGCQRVFHDGHYDFLFEGELHHAVTPRGKSDGKAVQFVSHGPFAAVVSLAQACLGVNCVRPCCKPVSPTGGERRALLSDARVISCG